MAQLPVNKIEVLTQLEIDNQSNNSKGDMLFNNDTSNLQYDKTGLGDFTRIVDETNMASKTLVYISNSGSDSTGNGTIAFPYATASYAASQITDNSSSKPYKIVFMPGIYSDTTFNFKPYISYEGNQSDWTITNIINLDSSFSSGGNVWIENFYLVYALGGCSLDFNSLSPTAFTQINFRNLGFICSAFTITGANSFATLIGFDTVNLGGSTCNFTNLVLSADFTSIYVLNYVKNNSLLNQSIKLQNSQISYNSSITIDATTVLVRMISTRILNDLDLITTGAGVLDFNEFGCDFINLPTQSGIGITFSSTLLSNGIIYPQLNDFNLSGQLPPDNTDAGAVNLSAADGSGATASNGGNFNIKGGDGSGTAGAAGGSASLTAGAAPANGQGGHAYLKGGDSGATSTAGNAYLRAGIATSGTQGKIIQDIGDFEISRVNGDGIPTQLIYKEDNTVSSIWNMSYDANNSLNTRVTYANMRSEIVSNTAGDEYGNTIFSVSLAGGLLDILQIGGLTNTVKSNYDMTSATNYNFDTTISAGQGWDVIHKILSGEAIASGAMCKSSTTTAFRLEAVKSTDPITTPVIAVTTNSTAGAGETQTVSGMTILNVLVDENVAIGDPLKKSSTTNGRAVIATPGDSGIFAVSLQAQTAGSQAIAAKVITAPETSGGATPGRLLNVQVITAVGVSTYTPTVGTNNAIVYLTGGGGGGGGAGVAGTGQTAGGTGGTSLFGAIFAASGGAGGGFGTGGVSGDGGLGSASAGGTYMIPGSGGTTGYLCGGAGGSSHAGGGAAAKGGNSQSGYNASANSGAGGGGGTYVSFAAGGGGGGATGVYYYNSVVSQSVTIGAGGTAGTAGISGGAGGTGGSGICIIYEYS